MAREGISAYPLLGFSPVLFKLPFLVMGAIITLK